MENINGEMACSQFYCLFEILKMSEKSLNTTVQDLYDRIAAFTEQF